ncbi:MAG: hypothetical protein Aurels2KO_29320 [Aureliella sp.]
MLAVEPIEQLPATVILDRLGELALIISRDGRTLHYANPRAAARLGWTAQELTSFSPWTERLLIDSSTQTIARLLDNDALPQDQSALQFRNSGGMLVDVQLQAVFADSDRILLLGEHHISDDAAEEVLRQTNARFRSIVDSLSINLVLKDREGRRVYANEAYLRLRNQQLNDILGKRDEDLFPPELAAQFSADDRHVLETGELIHKFEENVGADQSKTWTEIIKGPLRDADDNITGVQIVFWDASARKATELELQRERYLLHALLDNVPDSIYFKDRESRFVRISRGMAEKFDLENPGVAIGKTDADIFTPEHAEQALEDERRIMQTGEPIVAQVERETWPDREDTWCSTTKLRLHDSDGKVVGTFGISRDVTEMMAIESQLRETRDQAFQASQAKSEFLANMSHEIRTPMNGIIGMSELLSHTNLSETQQSYLGMIQQSAHSLLRIINDILDFSKIEAGKLDIESVRFHLPKTLSESAKGLAMRAAKKAVELKLDIAPDIPDYLSGDPARLRQVLVNLAGNSIKFTESGSITIRAEIASGPPADEDYTLHFSVADTGIGIPASKQAAIFEAFSQADVSTTRTYGGTGLGLSISSQLVDMMGGNIWLESEVGIGSTFHFTCRFSHASKPTGEDSDISLSDLSALLVNTNDSSRNVLQSGLEAHGLQVVPAQNNEQATKLYHDLPDAPERSVFIVDQSLDDHKSVRLIEELQSIAPQKSPITILLSALPDPLTAKSSEKLKSVVILQKPALPSEICEAIRRVIGGEQDQTLRDADAATPTRPLNLLLAEDGEVNRAIMLGLLGEAGHNCQWVEDGEAAVALWGEQEFDAILMDIQMPKMDGLQATRAIREIEAQQQSSRTPIIAITAGAMSSDQTECFDAGMDDYLSKPIDFDALHDLLNRLQEHSNKNPFAQGSPPSAATTAATDEDPDTVAEDTSSSLIVFDAPLKKLRVSPEQHITLIETLRNEVIQRLDELTSAISTSDAKLLVRASHSLKSAAYMFEAVRVSHISERIETAARAGDLTVAAERFAQLRQISNSMLQEIDAWLSERRAE